MKKFIVLFMFTLIVGVGMASVSYAAEEHEAPTPRLVAGDLLKIEGQFYVVKDLREVDTKHHLGKEVRLHVDNTTKLKGTFKPGDKIRAEVTEENHALWIEHGGSVK